jgi:hypothetical protein
MKFIIESSLVPIYNRIATAFTKTLIEYGHNVLFINAHDFTEDFFINTINDIEHDYYITTNELNFIQRKTINQEEFIFEKINSTKIFIHHDNLFSTNLTFDQIKSKIEAYINIKNNSHHFCLESSNIELLNNLGIKHAYKINHASEFENNENTAGYKYKISFVGHLMSSLNLYPIESLFCGSHLISCAWNRINNSSYLIQPQINNLVRNNYFPNLFDENSEISVCTSRQYLISELNKLSSPMRGQLLSMIKDHQVDIFGGDLSYGKISDPLLKISQNNIKYHAATHNYQEASPIYNSSQINLNISSLQFDTAINNRILDIIMSNGFLLTDRRADLIELSNLFEIISFDTPEEMLAKINFWLDSANSSKYYDLKNELFKICKAHFSYIKCIETIFSKLN